MTLVTYTVERDRVEILTDSLAYGAAMAELAFTTKVTLLSHIDAAVVVKGATKLAGMWLGLLHIDASLGSNFDGLVDRAPEELRELWECLDDGWERQAGAWIHVVGWSESRRRFVAYVFAHDDGFAGEEVPSGRTYCSPEPEQPLDTKPATDADWVRLGSTVYAEQARTPVMSGRKTLIGGALHLTTLARSAATTRNIHSFADDDLWRDMLIGSYHRLGQIGPCPCGSGQPFVACHMRWQALDVACPCESGRPFAECHQVSLTDDVSAFEYWRTHADDFHRTQDQLAAAWAKAFPDEPTPPPPPSIIPPKPTRDAP